MKSLWLLALVPAVALAKPPAGCSLLTSAEIGGATGMKVGQSHETSMPTKGGQMNGCMWRLGENGMVNVSLLPATGTKADREKGLAGLRQTYEVLKSRGWTIGENKFGDTLCNTATPPKAEADHTPAMAGCFAMAKGFVYSVGVMGPHFTTPPEKVKALADDIAKRLP
jgi:hypothetical protein